MAEFKRINVFKGFIRTAKDYRDGVRYHVRKQRLHNRLMHNIGVVSGVEGELRVRARRRPNMSVEISPGFAIDPKGCDVLVRGVQVKELIKEDFILPQTVYMVLKYKEDETDFKRIELPGFPVSEGLSRISEMYEIEWSIAEPDMKNELELCRILLTREVRSLRNAVDPNNPREGEIDLRFVPKATRYRGTLGLDRSMLRELLFKGGRAYTHMARTRDVPSALSAATACSALAVLNEAMVLDEDGLNDCLDLLHDIELEVIRETESNEPKLAKRPKFQAFAKRVRQSGEALQGLYGMDVSDRVGAMGAAMKSQLGALEALYQVIRPPEPAPRGPLVPGEGIRVLDGTEWEKLKEDSKVPPLSIVVEGQEWRLIDDINILDRNSMANHQFAIREATDWWRSKLDLMYPDQAKIQDDGICHEGGYAEWRVRNVVPGLPLVVVRRMDYGRADYECTVWIDDIEAGEVPCAGQDTRYRWRNWPFCIDGGFVRTREPRIRQYINTSNRDVNYFRLWFYQPI
ncbi:MAG: hypothetical protein CMH57_10170 [Myxococcales bacterium]|nr:hypothetical protein [Myxococcales bacterium]